MDFWGDHYRPQRRRPDDEKDVPQGSLRNMMIAEGEEEEGWNG